MNSTTFFKKENTSEKEKTAHRNKNKNLNASYLISSYGTITQTGITCKKISFYEHNSACRWRLVEKAKIFLSYVKHFEFLRCEKLLNLVGL